MAAAATNNFLDEITGNVDFSSGYQDLADEVTGKLQQAQKYGIQGILSGTGQNKNQVEDTGAGVNREGLTGPVAQAAENRTRMNLAAGTASKLGANATTTNNAIANTQVAAGKQAIGMNQQQNQSQQQMLGNIVSGAGSIGGTLIGNSSMGDYLQQTRDMQAGPPDISPSLPSDAEMSKNNNFYGSVPE